MILTCNECDTKFLIKAEDLGDKGRRVRCGSCAAVWFVKPPEASVAAVEKQVIKEQKQNLQEAVEKQAAGVIPSLPAVYEPVTPPKWLKAAVVVLIFANVAAGIFLNKKMIGQTSFYDMVGQYQTDDVEITNAAIKTEAGKKGAKNYSVEWSIVNNAKDSRELPSRRIKVLDKDLAVIDKGSSRKDLMVKSGEILPFEPTSVLADGKAKYVVLEIGSPYELMRR